MHGFVRHASAAVLLAIASLMLTPSVGMAQAMTPGATAGLPTCAISSKTTTPAASPSTMPATSRSMPLQPVVDIPLPGDASRFDYQSLDPTTGRLYIAHMGADQVVVFDTVSQTVVGIVDHLPTVTGVLAVPEVNRVYAAVAGDNQVSVIDPDTLTIIARVGNIGFPDGLAFVPKTGEVYISDESGGGEVVLDTADDTVVTTIDVGGEAGNTHYDAGSGCVLVAIQSENQLLAIDPINHEVVGRYDMHAGCKAPHGFLIDAPARQAFVSCEDSATLLVVNLATMQVMGAFPTGEGPDVLAFDPGWGRLYVASESGIVSIFDAQDETLRPVGEYEAPRAHSVEVDPSTHLVYLPLEDVDGHPVLRILTPLSPGT